MTSRDMRVTLITKPGCHLCTLARQVIERVADDLGVGWQELLLHEVPDADPLWREQVPVTLVDGRMHDYWRVSETRLREALAASPATPSAGSTAS